jgi:hypothetical protein
MNTLPATVAPADNFSLLAASASNIQGLRLKFRKGEYVIGKDEGTLPPGTRLEALDVQEGWTHFVDGAVVEQIMHEAGVAFPLREDLSDPDESMWPAGPGGKPADPWVLNAYLYLVEVDTRRDFTFLGSSVGSRKAVMGLARQVHNARRASPGAVPVVELATTHWVSRQYGKIASPDFRVVGWIGTASAPALPGESLDDEIPF